MLKGHALARGENKEGLKSPAEFRKIIEQKFGPDCFITSEDGQKALIYPLPVWSDYQARLSKVPSASQPKKKILERLNYFGSTGTMDGQGRVLIPAILRRDAAIADDVVVIGSDDHL